MSRPKRSSGASPVLPSAATEAFANVQAKLAALPVDSLITTEVDVAKAVSSVLTVLPKLKEFRPRIVAELPKFPVANLDHLETYALAAWYAHLLAAAPEGNASTLTEEATVLREGLLVAAEALAYRSFIEKDRVEAVRKSDGDLSHDLALLAELYRESWDRIRGKTAVEEREINRAAELTSQLTLLAAAQKHNAGASVEITQERVQRAFTLLAQAYSEVRRAVTYLRWHEKDVDSFFPTLVKSSRGRKPGSKNKEESNEAEAPVEE